MLAEERVLARFLKADDLDYDAPKDLEDPTGDVESMKRGDKMRFAKLDTFWKKTFGALLIQTKKDLEALAAKTNSDEYKQDAARLIKLIVAVLKTGEDYGTLKKEFAELKMLWTLDLDEVFEKLMRFEGEYRSMANKIWKASNIVKQMAELSRLERVVYSYSMPKEIRESFNDLEDNKLPAVAKFLPLPGGAHPPYQLRGGWLGAEVAGLLGGVLQQKHLAAQQIPPEDLEERVEEEKSDARRAVELKKALSTTLLSFVRKVGRELEKAIVVEWGESDVDIYSGATGKWGEARMVLSRPREPEFLAFRLKVEDYDENKLANAVLKVSFNTNSQTQWEESYDRVPDPRAIVSRLPRDSFLAVTLDTRVYDWNDRNYTTHLLGLSEKAVKKEAVKFETLAAAERIKEALERFREDFIWHEIPDEGKAELLYENWLYDEQGSYESDEVKEAKKAEIEAEAKRAAAGYMRDLEMRLIPAEKVRLEAEFKKAIEERTRHAWEKPIRDLMGLTDDAKRELVRRLLVKPSAVVQLPYKG